MSRLARALAVLFPSVPVADRARIHAAMEGRDHQTPAPPIGGEAVVGAGHTREGTS
jgi:hypothetical protein